MKNLFFSETIIGERNVVVASVLIVRNVLGIADTCVIVRRSWHGCHLLNDPLIYRVCAMSQSEDKAAKSAADQAVAFSISIDGQHYACRTHHRSDLHLVGLKTYHPDA